jgi:hypothetical protein
MFYAPSLRALRWLPTLVFYPESERATRDLVRAGAMPDVDFGEGGLGELPRKPLLGNPPGLLRMSITNEPV